MNRVKRSVRAARSALWAHRPIAVKGLVVVMAPVVAALVTAALLVAGLRDTYERGDLARRAIEIQREISHLAQVMVNAETGMRGYLATGERRFLEPYDLALEEVDEELGKLETLVTGRDQEALLDRVRSLVALNLNHLRGPRSALDDRDARAMLTVGKEKMDELRDALADMDRRIARVLEVRANQHVAARRRTLVLAVAGVLSVLVGGAVGGLLFSRGIARRVRRLVVAASRASHGRTSEPDGGRDEVAALDHALRAAALLVAQRGAERDAAERRLRRFIEELPVAVYVSDPRGRPVYANERAREVLDAAELVDESAGGVRYRTFLAGTDDPYPLDRLPRVRAFRGEASSVDDLEIASGGRRRLLQTWAAPLPDDDGSIPYAMVTFVDITEDRLAEVILRRAQERFRRAFDNAFTGFAIANTDGRFVDVNGSFCDMLGYGRGELLEVGPLAVTHPDDADAMLQTLRRLARGDVDHDTFETRFLHHLGATVWARVAFSVITDEKGAPLQFFGQIQDVTEQRAARENLRRMALHDGLTGLPNRALFYERSEAALARLHDDPGHVAVLYVDLDGFKPVNDEHGHAAGDEVLRTVGARLARSLRERDTGARLGGDEFAVLLDGVASTADAERIARRLVDRIGAPITLANGTLRVGASIGVTSTTNGAVGIEELLAEADAALYAAKRAGKGQVAVAAASPARGGISAPA